MLSLAKARIELAQQYERALAKLDADPRSATHPEAYNRALLKLDLAISPQKMAIAASEVARERAVEAAMDGYVRHMMSGVAMGAAIDPGLPGWLADDSRLSADAKMALLFRYYEMQAKAEGRSADAALDAGQADNLTRDVRERIMEAEAELQRPRRDVERAADP